MDDEMRTAVVWGRSQGRGAEEVTASRSRRPRTPDVKADKVTGRRQLLRDKTTHDTLADSHGEK